MYSRRGCGLLPWWGTEEQAHPVHGSWAALTGRLHLALPSGHRLLVRQLIQQLGAGAVCPLKGTAA